MAFALAIALLLAAYSSATNVLSFPGWMYVPSNLAIGAALVGAARAAGLSWRELGLGREAVGPGLRWGGAIVLALAAMLALAPALPPARGFLEDKRVAGIGPALLAYRVLVRIPIGTALFEEVAFRGVLYGALARHASTATAVLASSAAFGLWHIGPTLENARINQPDAGAAGTAWIVAGGVVATFIGGVLFASLRIHTRGIVAPVIAHAGANSLATLAAWLWQRR